VVTYQWKSSGEVVSVKKAMFFIVAEGMPFSQLDFFKNGTMWGHPVM